MIKRTVIGTFFLVLFLALLFSWIRFCTEYIGGQIGVTLTFAPLLLPLGYVLGKMIMGADL